MNARRTILNGILEHIVSGNGCSADFVGEAIVVAEEAKGSHVKTQLRPYSSR